MKKQRNVDISVNCPMTYLPELCSKTGCAWWNVEEEACAVLVISEKLPSPKNEYTGPY